MSSDEVPPGARCSAEGCTREAVDPMHPAGRCPEHQPDAGDDRDDSEEFNQQNTPDDGSVLVKDEPADPGRSWSDAEFTAPERGVFPTPWDDREQWMCHTPGEKKAFAPWGDRDHPDADEDDDARWKWGLVENYADLETAREWTSKHPDLAGVTYLLREADEEPHAFVDGDDVRCPETGEVHPEFVRVLSELGMTYADVSVSGTGIHAPYAGSLPDGVKEATFEIDSEPWGENDDTPTIEFYDHKHVCVSTGEHVPGTPQEIREWDSEALESVLDEYDQLPDETPSTDREDYDLEDYEPKATDADETTTDIRDQFKAVERLDAKRVAQKTIVSRWNDSASTSEGARAFYPTWGSSNDNGTANYVNSDIWHDTGDVGGYGGAAVMALIDANVISNRNADPSDTRGKNWFKAMDHLRSLGFDIPELEDDAHSGDAEPVAALGLEALDSVAEHERQRVADRHDVEIPSTDEARKRLRDAILREMRNGNQTVLDAPTALGKSHTVATEPWIRRADVTGEAPVVHFHATKDARDEAAAESADAVSSATLKGRHELCPVAAGDHDPVDDPDDEDSPEQIITIDGEPASDWFDRQCDDKGLPFSTAHALAHERNDQGVENLPCTEDGECDAITQWDGLPRTDDGHPTVDVIHATHQFAHVPSLRQHTNVVLDEQPDFSVEFSDSGSVEAETARVRSIVNAYLQEIDAPTTTWEAFVSLARLDNSGGDSDAARIRDALDDVIGTEPRTEWFIEDPEAHAVAADLTKAVWNALRWNDPDANGRRSETVRHKPPRLDVDDEESYASTHLSVVIDEENNIRSVRSTPNFSQARSVIGLDAHPSMPLWRVNADADMSRDAVLDPDERRLWRRYERGLTVVQVGDATRPRSGSSATEWMNDERVRTVTDRLREHYGGGFRTAITTSQVERRVRDILGEFDPNVDEDHTMHYGEEKSRNDFAQEPVGLLYGCMDPGDEMILDVLAELGLDAEPATAETDDGGTVREKGRTFEGPDAETAQSVLASVRENHVAQAAGRYARNPDDPDSEAVVFAMTDAHPSGFVDVETPGVEWLATDIQREIVDVLAEQPSATAREIADAVDCSKRHVLDTLETLAENDLVDRHDGAGDYGADLFRLDGDGAAVVDLGFSEITNDPLCDSSRWSFAISLPTLVETASPGESNVAPTHTGEKSGGGSAGPPPR